jgi:hypothetical protein
LDSYGQNSKYSRKLKVKSNQTHKNADNSATWAQQEPTTLEEDCGRVLNLKKMNDKFENNAQIL